MGSCGVLTELFSSLSVVWSLWRHWCRVLRASSLIFDSAIRALDYRDWKYAKLCNITYGNNMESYWSHHPYLSESILCLLHTALQLRDVFFIIWRLNTKNTNRHEKFSKLGKGKEPYLCAMIIIIVIFKQWKLTLSTWARYFALSPSTVRIIESHSSTSSSLCDSTSFRAIYWRKRVNSLACWLDSFYLDILDEDYMQYIYI